LAAEQKVLAAELDNINILCYFVSSSVRNGDIRDGKWGENGDPTWPQ
jgi:hypothetical protein